MVEDLVIQQCKVSDNVLKDTLTKAKRNYTKFKLSKELCQPKKKGDENYIYIPKAITYNLESRQKTSRPKSRDYEKLE